MFSTGGCPSCFSEVFTGEYLLQNLKKKKNYHRANVACEFGAGGAEVGVRKCLSVHTASLPPGCQSWLDSVVVLGGFCASARMA